MQKKHVTDSVAAALGETQVLVKRVVAEFLAELSDNFAVGNGVDLRGFGNFRMRVRRARVGRNPRRPEQVYNIPEKRWMVFKPSKKLIRRMNP